MHRFVLVSLFGVGAFGCDSAGTPVRASLADGQVVSGAVRTDVLQLETGMGTVYVPLADVGEVVPVEGAALGGSQGHVTVWLRNGSELVGRWASPELTIAIAVGGEDVDVDLPMNGLARFQTQAGELWPDSVVYRVRTNHGDDLLVDPELSRITIDSDLGRFSPILSECRSARPLGEPEGDWRIELDTGTVLIGPLAQSGITFALPLGPDTITVPMDMFVTMERQDWRMTAHGSASADAPPIAAEAPAEQHPMPAPQPAGWFDNRGLQDKKAQQKLDTGH